MEYNYSCSTIGFMWSFLCKYSPIHHPHQMPDQSGHSVLNCEPSHCESKYTFFFTSSYFQVFVMMKSRLIQNLFIKMFLKCYLNTYHGRSQMLREYTLVHYHLSPHFFCFPNISPVVHVFHKLLNKEIVLWIHLLQIILWRLTDKLHWCLFLQ